MKKNKKKTILHILNSNSFSGAENVVLSIICNLRNDYDFVYMSRDGSIRKILEQYQIKHCLVSKLSVGEIKDAVKKYQPDVIHAHDFTAGILSAATFTKIPIISHIHNNSPWLQSYGVYSFLYLASTVRYRDILTVSDSVMNEYVFGKYLKKKTSVVANPVDMNSVRERAAAAELCDESDVAFFGRLTEAKNPMLFLDIMNLLVQMDSTITCAMIGDGDMRKQVEDRIKELHLMDHVRMYGFQENPFGLIKNTRVVCMPSLWEGFGLTAVESMALAKPVVAAKVGGLVDIVNETCGNFCEQAKDYADTIYRYLTEEELLKKKSMGAIKRAEELDNLNDYIQEIKTIYLKMGNVCVN